MTEVLYSVALHTCTGDLHHHSNGYLEIQNITKLWMEDLVHIQPQGIIQAHILPLLTAQINILGSLGSLEPSPKVALHSVIQGSFSDSSVHGVLGATDSINHGVGQGSTVKKSGGGGDNIPFPWHPTFTHCALGRDVSPSSSSVHPAKSKSNSIDIDTCCNRGRC